MFLSAQSLNSPTERTMKLPLLNKLRETSRKTATSLRQTKPLCCVYGGRPVSLKDILSERVDVIVCSKFGQTFGINDEFTDH